MIESDDTDLAGTCAISHIVDLRVDGCFDALYTRDVSHAHLCTIHELVRSIAELAHHLSVQLRDLVTLNLVLALHWLCDTH